MDQNPYESPKGQPSEKLPRGAIDVEKIRRQNQTAVLVLLTLLSIPASFIAFFCVCVATGAHEIGGRPPKWGLIPSFAAAALVAAAFIYAIRVASKGYRGG